MTKFRNGRMAALALGLLGALAPSSCKVAIDIDDPTCGFGLCGPGQCCLDSCGGPDLMDVCINPPDACTLEFDPVCGCDGETYGNACQAHSNCVAVAHEGECEPKDGACDGDTCGAGQCCSEGCGGIEGTACVEPPDFCIELYDPVCGCDGNTYSNDCFAHMACTAVASMGPCE